MVGEGVAEGSTGEGLEVTGTAAVVDSRKPKRARMKGQPRTSNAIILSNNKITNRAGVSRMPRERFLRGGGDEFFIEGFGRAPISGIKS